MVLRGWTRCGTVVLAVAACTPTTPPRSPSGGSRGVSVTVRAVMESTHLDANAVQTTRRAPLTGTLVSAKSLAGPLVRSARVTSDGIATIRLVAGSYTLTSSLTGACYPKTIIVTALARHDIVELPCAAP